MAEASQNFEAAVDNVAHVYISHSLAKQAKLSPLGLSAISAYDDILVSLRKESDAHWNRMIASLQDLLLNVKGCKICNEHHTLKLR